MIDTFAGTELGSRMRRSHAKRPGRKPWWFASILNHYALPVLTALTIFFLAQRGCGPVPSPPTQQDNARERREIAVMLGRLQERDERLTKLERDRENQRKKERQERERQKEQIAKRIAALESRIAHLEGASKQAVNEWQRQEEKQLAHERKWQEDRQELEMERDKQAKRIAFLENKNKDLNARLKEIERRMQAVMQEAKEMWKKQANVAEQSHILQTRAAVPRSADIPKQLDYDDPAACWARWCDLKRRLPYSDLTSAERRDFDRLQSMWIPVIGSRAR